MAEREPWSFQAAVVGVFDFLVRDFGYEWVDRAGYGVGEMAEYRRYPIDIGIGWFKGEIDITFTVALDYAAGHEVFRPYLSRVFPMWQVATRQDPAAYADLSARMKGHGYITNLAAAKIYLEESARILKRFCTPILKGDLKLLEDITQERARPR